VPPYHVTETPAVLEKYKQASSQLLLALGAMVYPALREDAPNETGQYPVEYDVGGWYTFRIETRSGGLHYLLYQVIEELGRVLAFDLVTVREP
jgi:hypothetical protein